jgi:hypothetical protein
MKNTKNQLLLEKEQQIETLSNSLKQLNDLKKENKIELDKLRQENQVLQADFNNLQVFCTLYNHYNRRLLFLLRPRSQITKINIILKKIMKLLIIRTV